MPQTNPKEKNDNRRARSSRIIALWHKFHFSGRVIMCSVLFGLGIVLIGSLIFAINMDDDGNKPQYDNPPNEVPVKAPSNVVGPVVMGIGSFIVVAGIIMCLFETEVCRKKSGDSSPLISDRSANLISSDSEAAAVPSTSHSHRHGTHKISASPKRFKGRHAKSHSKEKKLQKSPKTPPITIETPKSFMTSSEDQFLTPPNTLNGHPALVHSNSRDAENQTSSSLMKSFTSSGPSWNQSSEFETPSTSFRDTSVENSIEIGENQEQENISTAKLPLLKSKMNVGFFTPISLDEEKIQEMSDNIRNQKKELTDTQYNRETDKNFDNDELSDTNMTPKSGTDLENIDTKQIQFQTKSAKINIEKSENMENKNSFGKLQSDQNTSSIEEVGSKQAAELIPTNKLMPRENSKSNSPENILAVSSEKGITNVISDGNVAADEKQRTIVEDDQKGKSNSEKDISNVILETNEDKNLSLTPDAESNKSENNKDVEQVDFEISVSSDETVVPEDSGLEKLVSNDILKGEKLETQGKLTDEVVTLSIVESANDALTPQNDGNNLPSTQSSVKENESSGPFEPKDSQNQSKDKEVVEEIEKLSEGNSS